MKIKLKQCKVYVKVNVKIMAKLRIGNMEASIKYKISY